MGSPSSKLLPYAAVALLAGAVATVEGRCPLVTAPWLELDAGGPGVLAHAASLALGAVVAGATIAATPALVRSWGRARALHAALRPSLRHVSSAGLVVVGTASAASEELLFRGALAPALGVVLSSLAFGLLHQVDGRGRWIWAGWAALMGAIFALVFLTTGSLLGPVVAHALVNVQNARFLRDTDVEAEGPARLGGLLREPGRRQAGSIASPSSIARTISAVR